MFSMAVPRMIKTRNESKSTKKRRRAFLFGGFEIGCRVADLLLKTDRKSE